MSTFDELLEDRIELSVGSIDELQRQGPELSCVAGAGRQRLAGGFNTAHGILTPHFAYGAGFLWGIWQWRRYFWRDEGSRMYLVD